MVQEAIAFFEFLDAHPSLGTMLQVACLIAIYVLYKSGKAGRAKLHVKVECVDSKVDSLRGDFDVHKATVETELKHLNGHAPAGGGD